MNARILIAVLACVVTGGHALAADWPTEPDKRLTPGKVNGALSLHTICHTKWGTDERLVSDDMKQSVRDAYHFSASACPLTPYKGKRVRRAEIDHLVPRSLGGADDTDNLWPQCYEPILKDRSSQADGAHKKDRLETELHKRLCAAPTAAKLKSYQHDFKEDWQALYRKTYGKGG